MRIDVRDVETAREVLLSSPERVSVESFRVWGTDGGSEVTEFFVFRDTNTGAYGNMAPISHRANFVVLKEWFIDNGFDYTTRHQEFAVRVDSPDEVLVFLADCVVAMEDVLILDFEVFSGLWSQEFDDFTDSLTEKIAGELGVDSYDIHDIVKDWVSDCHEHNGHEVILRNEGELIDFIVKELDLVVVES